jgi:hypothetical protein
VGTALVSLSVELIVATGSEFRQVRRAHRRSKNSLTFGHAPESGKPEHKDQGYPLTLPGSKTGCDNATLVSASLKAHLFQTGSR